MERKKDFILIVSTISVPVILITGMLFIIAHYHQGEGAPVATVSTPTPTPEPPPKSFPEVSIKASAAIVFDTQTNNVLFAKNTDTALPLASITKLMTALVAAEIAPGYSLITLDKDALSAEGDNGLRPNEIWKLQDLSDFTLTVSSNDGARAIASAIGAWQGIGLATGTQNSQSGREHFISLMNQKAKKIGLTLTDFKNESGLDIDATTPGARGSASDVSKLMTYILKFRPEIVDATRKEKIEVKSGSLITHNASNTNEAISKIPNIIASKTGYTDLAGGNLVVAFDGPRAQPHPIVIVVLGSTLEGRFTDTETLAQATEDYLLKK